MNHVQYYDHVKQTILIQVMISTQKKDLNQTRALYENFIITSGSLTAL